MTWTMLPTMASKTVMSLSPKRSEIWVLVRLKLAASRILASSWRLEAMVALTMGHRSLASALKVLYNTSLKPGAPTNNTMAGKL